MGTDKGKRTLKIVEVSGTHYEMGLQYGTACPEIKQVVETMCQIFDANLEKYKKFSATCIPVIQEYDPNLMDEMKGIAEGAKVDVDEIVLLNAWYEMSIYQETAALAGCTSFAAGGDATDDGELFIGQNFDNGPPMEDSFILLKMKPKDGVNILALATLGALGNCGINSAGITVNGNLLIHKDYTSPESMVPHFVITRKCLESTRLSKVMHSIAAAKRGPSVHQLFGSSEGDVIGMEVTPDDLGFLNPVDDIYVHSNNFVLERFKAGDIVANFYPDSFLRIKRLDDLMRKRKGSLSVDVMKELLQDHNNSPDSICRHADEELPPHHQAKTVASMISQPKDQKIHIAIGNPCENEYFEYQL